MRRPSLTSHVAAWCWFAAVALVLSAPAAVPSKAVAGGLIAAHPFADQSAVDLWGREMANCVGSSFGIPVELLPAGTIGRSDDLLDALRKGQLDLAILPVATIARVWSGIGLLLEPGAVTDPQNAIRLSRSESFLRALDDLGDRELGLSVVAVGWQYQVLALRDAEDDVVVGKRIRTLGEPNMRLLSELGATPFVLPRSEVFFALSFGVIDGGVVGADELEYLSAGKGGPMTLIWSDAFVPFVTPLAVVMSANTQRNWGEKLLFVLRSDCAEVAERFNRQSIEQAIESVRAAASTGMKVVDYDLATWREATAKAFDAAVAKSEARELAAQLRE
jgi:TRAP-type C4-dicarboxylate transport system substrate-binding protein